MLSLLWKMVAGIAAALGAAVVARTYTEAPPDVPAAPGAPSDGSTAPVAPAHGSAAPAAALHGQAPGAELRPGWSRPKPERRPHPTYWPMVFAFGLTFFFWGLISNLFVLGFGFVVFVIGLVGWIGDLLHEA